MPGVATNPHVKAVIARLGELVFPEGLDSLRVGDGVAPKVANTQDVHAPCVVVHLLPGGTLVSSVGELDTDGTLRFQTTSVGQTAEQARMIDDLCHDHLVDHPPTVAGRWVRVRPADATARTERDEDVTPPLFYAVRRFELLSNRAA